MSEAFQLIVFLPSVADAIASVRGSHLAPSSTSFLNVGCVLLTNATARFQAQLGSAHPTAIEHGARSQLRDNILKLFLNLSNLTGQNLNKVYNELQPFNLSY